MRIIVKRVKIFNKKVQENKKKIKINCKFRVINKINNRK